jgi:DNA primase
MANFRKGLSEHIKPNVDYLHGRIDPYELLEALDIEAAHKIGNNIMAHCPNYMELHEHGDRNPSFGLNMEKMKWNCFTCGGGDLIDLVCQSRNVDWTEAEQFLVELAHLDPQRDSIRDKLTAILHPRVDEPEPIPVYPKDALFKFDRVHPYLYKRGLTDEVIGEMQVGWDETHLGIVIPHVYMGQLVGWQTRHLAEPRPGVYACPTCSQYSDFVPKYKNTKGFPKKTTLYNYDNAIGYTDVHVVESPFTALYMKSHGIPNVVAHFGSPIGHAQSMLLVRFKRVYYWPDNDKAGAESTRHLIGYIRRFTELMVVPVAPGPKADASDLDPSALEQYWRAAYPAALFKLLGLTEIGAAPTTNR